MSLIWHQIKERPLTEPDTGCFVLCLGYPGWSCGTVLLTPNKKIVIHGDWKPFPTHTIDPFHIRVYALLGKTETPWHYESTTRPVTLADKGKLIFGKGSAGWNCGIIGDNFGLAVIMNKKDRLVGAASAD